MSVLIRYRSRRGMMLASAAIVSLVPIASYAQDATERPSATQPASDDIVVTATRRDTSLVNTPLAVAAVQGEVLERASVTSFQDLTRIEPSIAVNNQGATSNQFIIRGILSDVGSTTGFYVDEAPLVSASDIVYAGDNKPGLRMHDVQRVEVLKGPQGTLFGAGSLSGTLRVVNNRPDFDAVSGGAGMSVGTIQGGNTIQKADAFINVPLGEKIAVRVVGWNEEGGGFIDQLRGANANIRHDNVNDRHLYGGRISLLLKPTENFTLLATANHQNTKVDGIQSFNPMLADYVSDIVTPEPVKERYSLFTLTGEYDTGVGTITAIGTHSRHRLEVRSDNTEIGRAFFGLVEGVVCPGGTVSPDFPGAACPLSPTLLSNIYPQSFTGYTGELRFASQFDGPLQIVAGAYYQRDKSTSVLSTVRADNNGDLRCNSFEECRPRGLIVNGNYHDRLVNQWAVYGQLDYKVSPELTLTAGARYYRAKIEDAVNDYQGFFSGFAQIPDPTVPSILTEDTQSKPSFNFSALYEIAPRVSIYARAASGFRIGGANYNAGAAAQLGIDVPVTYGPDNIWSYEGGVKGYILSSKLYTELNVYQMNWSDLQVQALANGGQFLYTANAGNVRIRGAEFTTRYTDGPLSLTGGVTYTNATLRTDFPADVQSSIVGLRGDRVPKVPRWIFNAQGYYEVPIGDAMAYIQGDVSYKGSSFYDWNPSGQFYTNIPSYVLIGAAIGARIGKFDISAFVENLTNEVAYSGFYQDGYQKKVFPATPRTLGVRVRMDF